MNTECSICLVSFEERDPIVKLGCSHSFHYGCLLKWNLQSNGTNHNSCPLCRDNIGIEDTLASLPLGSQEEAPRIYPDDLIINPEYGLSIRCSDCDSDFYQCETCHINVCECSCQADMSIWGSRQFHAPENPFAAPKVLEEGEIPSINCYGCFTRRNEIVLEFMMEDQGYGDIFEHPKMIEFYETFYNDKSGKNNTEIYIEYPTLSFDEFRIHFENQFEEEMNLRSIDDIYDEVINLMDEDEHSGYNFNFDEY